LSNITVLTTDNKALKPQVKECKLALDEMLTFKQKLLAYEGREESVFIVSDYLKVKARILLGTMDDAAPKKEKKTKEKKEKAPKVDTKQVTYDLYCQGKGIADIAKERGLVVNTIAAHLAYYVKCGKLDVNKFVPQSKINEVVKYVNANPEDAGTLTAIKENVSSNISYADIRFVLASIETQ
jgi:uncharacterized protein YpbB